MARQTRSERRARRQAQQQSIDGAAAPRARPRQAATPAIPEPAVEHERHVPGGGVARFVRESVGELKKVEWPRQPQVIAGTTVVLIACVIVGIYLWINDRIWSYIVQNWLLGT